MHFCIYCTAKETNNTSQYNNCAFKCCVITKVSRNNTVSWYLKKGLVLKTICRKNKKSGGFIDIQIAEYCSYGIYKHIWGISKDNIICPIAVSSAGIP